MSQTELVFNRGELSRVHSGIILVNWQILLTALVGIAKENIPFLFLAALM